MKFPLKSKAVMLILVIVLMTSIVSIFISSRIIQSTGKKNYTRQAVHLADTIAVSVDGDQVREVLNAVKAVYEAAEETVYSDRWGEPEFDAYLARFSAVSEMAPYIHLREQLRKIQDVNDVLSLYITWLDVSTKTIVYLVDASDEDFCPPGVCDHFFYEDNEVLKNPERGFLPTITDSEEYGWLVATGSSIYDSSDKRCFVCIKTHF
ncbi:MAG: hypothetical protein IJ242_05405 [Clostridia bacterium]|nr:hypothetical protein [Clostridia bacterium]